MIAERIQGCGWDGVHRVLPNQFFHVEHVAVCGILGAGARPQDALSLRAFGSQRFPAITAENVLITDVGLFAVRNRNLAQKAFQLFLLALIFGDLQTLTDDSIDRIVNAADEEAGYAGDLADVAAARRQLFEASDVGCLRCLHIQFARIAR